MLAFFRFEVFLVDLFLKKPVALLVGTVLGPVRQLKVYAHGKQLVVDFETGNGDDLVETPDLMRWEIFDIGTGWGALNNAMTVPNRWSRRLDVAIRPASEYAPRVEDQAMRVDELGEQPDWWTPEGGEIDVYNPLDGYE